jgi:glycosyl transferase family 87
VRLSTGWPTPIDGIMTARGKAFGTLALFVGLPCLFVSARFGLDSVHLVDFRNLWEASRDVLAGRSIYHPSPDPRLPVTSDCLRSGPDCFVYPPLAAVVAVPFGLLPFSVAGVAFFVADLAALGAALYLAGVRDWRCYSVAAASAPVLSAIEGGTMTPFLAVVVAAAWRYRDSRLTAPAAVAAGVVAKVFLWPLVVWFAATRRTRSALLSIAGALVLGLASWSVVGLAGLSTYPHLLRTLSRVWAPHAYGPMGLGLSLGLPFPVAEALMVLTGATVLAAAVVLARREGLERTSFALTVAAMLLLSPVVWLNYFLVLLVPLGIAHPRLDRAWALTVPFLFLPGMADGRPVVNLVALALGAAITWSAASPGQTRVTKVQQPAELRRFAWSDQRDTAQPKLDLPDAVRDELHGPPRLANADGV